MWVNEYLMEEHGEAAALAIIADIDHWQVIQWLPGSLVKSLTCLEFRLYLLSPDYDGSWMVAILYNGQGMTPRHL